MDSQSRKKASPAYISVAAAASILRSSRLAVQKLIDSGHVGVLDVPGTYLRVKASDVRAVLAMSEKHARPRPVHGRPTQHTS
jgi:hypothetical protein